VRLDPIATLPAEGETETVLLAEAPFAPTASINALSSNTTKPTTGGAL
jgi:hypothetical protein